MKKLLSLGLLSAFPLLAQDGGRISLQVASARPLVDGDQMANRVVVTSPVTTVTFIDFPYDRHTPLTLSFGWTAGQEELALDLFSTSKKSSATERGTNLGYASSTYSRIDGETKLEAMVFDAAWRHHLARNGSMDLAFSAGVRYADLKHENHQLLYGTPGETLQYDLTTQSKGKAYGLTTGLHGRAGLGEKAWVKAGATLAFMEDTVTNHASIINTPSTGAGIQVNFADGHRHLTQSEAYLQMGTDFGSHVQAYLGYEWRQFGKESLGLSGPPIPNLPFVLGFGLAGFTLGVTLRF